jgi:DNA-binding XRE family transcriptional regulator
VPFNELNEVEHLGRLEDALQIGLNRDAIVAIEGCKPTPWRL